MKKAEFDSIANKFGISNITARLIRNRDVCSDDEIASYLNGDISGLHEPKDMADMEKGAAIMLDRIANGARIRVIGDYDVDGICSSFILVSGLRLFGGDVDCVLPDRVRDGYGLSDKLVDDANDAGVDTIITCDNGIAAAEQVQHAIDLGMTVVVTDHHEVPYKESDSGERTELLPPAAAVIDPKRQDGNYAFKEICGAVVAYKFLQTMAEHSGQREDNTFIRFFDEMLIFAGIATVCDVMELRNENRIIVRKSLELIKNTENKGLRALINVNGLEADKMSAYHYGFVIGPCLNATGRLDLAQRALSLFLEEDENEAVKIAADLKALNDSRKDMTKKGVDEAVEAVSMGNEELPRVIVLYMPDVHESIAGIIAGKVKEKFYRPTIILTNAADGGAKGSGRSIEGYDMFSALSECRELFTKFGGHKMAAGLSLPIENIDELKKRLNSGCTLDGDDFEQTLHIDMVMPLKYADMQLVREFSLLEPYGNGNPKPLFAQRDVKLLSGRILGKNRNCGKYKVSDDSGIICDMMYFGDMDSWHDFLNNKYGEESVNNLYNGNSDGNMKVSIAYYPDINSYKGHESIQIIMNDYM